MPVISCFYKHVHIHKHEEWTIPRQKGCEFPLVIQKYTKLAILLGYIFRIFQHFATKFCTFTIFDMLFSAVVMDFVFHVLIKI